MRDRTDPQPLRVLLVSANFRPSVGGIEQFVENLAHGLAARGHTVTVAACRTDRAPTAERDGAVRIVRIPATDILHKRLSVPYPVPEPLAALRTLRRLIADADLVHPHDAIYATSVVSLALARRRHVASVLTQHVAFVPQRSSALDAAQRAAINTLARLGSPRASPPITPSRRLGQDDLAPTGRHRPAARSSRRPQGRSRRIAQRARVLH